MTMMVMHYYYPRKHVYILEYKAHYMFLKRRNFFFNCLSIGNPEAGHTLGDSPTRRLHRRLRLFCPLALPPLRGPHPQATSNMAALTPDNTGRHNGVQRALCLLLRISRGFPPGLTDQNWVTHLFLNRPQVRGTELP